MWPLGAIDPSEPLSLVAALVAAVATLALTHPAADRLGRDTRFWRRVRALLPYVDAAARERGFYTSYQVSSAEVVGHVAAELPTVEAALRDRTFHLSPLAAHKTFDDRGEVGSWARHGPLDPHALPWPLSAAYLLAYPYQLHVTLFPDGRGGVTVTAHYEYSAYNPLVAWWHLRGRGVDVDRGVAEAAAALADVDAFVPSDRALRLVRTPHLEKEEAA